VKLKVAKYLKA